MRALIMAAALFSAAPALACPAADAAQYQEAARKVEATEGTKVVLAVQGMHCGDCSEKVTAAIQQLPGVHAVAVDYQTGTTNGAYGPAQVAPEAFIKAVKELGYEASAQS